MKCKLCGNEYTKLCESHIIPELVYKRIKLHKRSRFRDLNNVNKVLQDGEKYPMLCLGCENKFSALESNFARKYLDIYSEKKRLPSKNKLPFLDDYIYSVCWRILNDDLFRMKSYIDSWERTPFEEFERYLKDCFNGKIAKPLDRCENYIYKLESLISNKEIIEISKSLLFGYSYFDIPSQRFMVITYYAGFVFVTTYRPEMFIHISQCTFLATFTYKFKSIKHIARKEFIKQFYNFCKEYDQKITPQLLVKIKKFYDK